VRTEPRSFVGNGKPLLCSGMGNALPCRSLVDGALPAVHSTRSEDRLSLLLLGSALGWGNDRPPEQGWGNDRQPE